MKQKIAYLTSRILGPAPLSILLWLVVSVKSGIGFWKAIWVYPLIFVFSLGIPLSITTYLVLTKRVKNIDWSDLSDRIKYLPPIAISAGIILLLLTYFFTNQTIFHLSLLLVMIVICELLIYILFKFKISGHITLASITVAGINLFFHLQFLWLYLILIPLMWARYTLKVHSLKELLAGLLLTNGILVLAIIIFGWPAVP